MKLRAIELENVRGFTARARIDGVGDGINVLCQPNEFGKSTIFDAVQALLFKPHGSRDREVMALRPHAGGAPEVTVKVETADGLFTIAKRWLSRPVATVRQGDRLIAQADAAEAWIGQLLGGGEGGPSGLVWVRQGMTGLADGSRREQEMAQAARRDLLSSVTGEVETMTGGRRMDMALSRCRNELSGFATGTYRPRAGGPWKDAQDRVDALRARREELVGIATALHDALDQRKRKRRELGELDAPEAVAQRKARLEEAENAHREAQWHADSVQAEAQKVDAARSAVISATRRLEEFRACAGEQLDAERSSAEALAAAETARAEHDATKAALAEALAALRSAQVAHREADEHRRLAQRRQAARDGALRRIELAQRIESAEKARVAIEEAIVSARRGPDPAAMRRLETLTSDLAAAVAARDAAATQIVMAYARGRDGAVTLDGSPLPADRPVAIPSGAELDIEGVGRLSIRPGIEGQQDDQTVAAAERALRTALDELGHPDLDAARASANRRVEAERHHAGAKAAFESLAPKGIAALREMLAQIPEAEDSVDGPDTESAEAAFTAAEAQLIEAQSHREAVAERCSDAAARAARAEAAGDAAKDRVARAMAARGRFGEADQETLEAKFGRASSALAASEALLEERKRAAPDPMATEAALKRARAVEETARQEIARLRPEIAALNERIAHSSGDAVEERLAETEQELEAAEAALARIEREVTVLRRLEAALEEARADARERYFEPVAQELKPLLHLLWPESELTWGDQTLLPESLIRGGAEEPIEILSGGTQEQVALLVRLAFARMLAKNGRHAPVILDDALVFTDDDRIERMFDALHRQASDLQIIILSCRQRAFRDLGGCVLRLAAPDPAGAVA